MLPAVSRLACDAALLLNFTGPCKTQRFYAQTRQHGTAAGACAKAFACVNLQLPPVHAASCSFLQLKHRTCHESYRWM
jgi:hypothetical protein